jgi:uncharacterized protein YjiS (DUF1127 family)
MSAVTHHMLTDCQTFQRSSSARQLGIAGRIARIVGVWRSRIRDRQAFANLDDRDLRDLGVSRWEVERELVKPFWRG